MNLSEDEDEFQSADEDGFDNGHQDKKISDIEYPNISESEIKSCLPPAPPPTPALSSSFNSDDPIGTTQYGWRIPHKTTKPKPETLAADITSEQARQSLDRLSEKLSNSSKNLFGKVAQDIKNVSIKSENPNPEYQCSTSSSSSGIPLISELGNTLGSWNWNSATRLLASASQVTSQVGSVLDSVVNASQIAQQTNQVQRQDTSIKLDTPKQPVKVSQDEQTISSNASMSASDANSNDALVDFTLNAMESLGRKAFGAMTERDESGSLQIKGLGRPWEHLLNLKKSQQPTQSQDALPEYEEVEPSISLTNGVRAEHNTSLKNRKRHPDYSDDDKLD